MPVIDLTGMVFGRLRVLKRAPNIGNYTAWLCRCKCGAKKAVHAHLLKNGNTQSCGCQKAEKARVTCLRRTKHGDNRRGIYVPEYKAWAEMLQRCLNENYERYLDYGGRGIKVCRRWLKYENFLADMGRKPTDAWYSLDRIDNDSGYRPSNCRWATRKQQANNRRTPVRVSGVKYKKRRTA